MYSLKEVAPNIYLIMLDDTICKTPPGSEPSKLVLIDTVVDQIGTPDFRIKANLPAEFTSDDLKMCLENYYKKYAKPAKTGLRIL